MREFLHRAQAATGDGGRLPLGAMPGWEVFPWEAHGLRARPLTDYAVPEPDRSADPASCKTCRVLADPDRVLGAIGDFVVIWVPTSLVFTANVVTREHVRLEDLDPASYAGMGEAIGRAYTEVRSLPGVGNVHVNKWENGKGHCSFALLARPEGVLQLRGSNLPAWADMLPATPLEELRTRAEQVRAALAG